MKKSKAISYEQDLRKSLKNAQFAAEYLNACYEDSEEVFIAGLRNVVEARGGMSKMAKITDLNRESLYRSLSKKGNPKFSNLSALLQAVGITLKFQVDSKNLTTPRIKDFDKIINKARKQAKSAGMKKSDIAKA